jgi:hypothetical protein
LFPLFATGVDTGGKFAAGVVDTGGKLPPCCWYRRQFAAGVVATGGKFATSINNTFRKNLKRS